MHRIIIALVLLLTFTAQAAFAQDRKQDGKSMEITSPGDLWRDYDPTALPLEVETLQTWQENGCSFAKVRFTGESVSGAKVRIFGIQGAPTGGKRLPGILHIHGGGQTASLAWVQFWAKRGYVCVSFDFCGPWANRTEVTDWGPIAHANMAQANGGFQVHPTPRESSWYHWTVAARRALTLLAQHPAVDADRLGIFGISVGGNLTWMVAGSDKRVKTAVAIYGSGYNYDRRKAQWGFGELSDDLARFKQTLSPEAHAPYVTCPLLHLDATNDFHAWMDYSYEILGAARGPVRQAFTLRYNHHIEPEQGADLERWMDWHLRGGKSFPKSPAITIRLDAAGVPQAVITADHPEEVEEVHIYATLGDAIPPARYWRSVPVLEKPGGKRQWEAELPVMDAWANLRAFANVRYHSGVCLSSNLANVLPAQLGQAKATLQWNPTLEQGHDGLENWFFTAAYTDPNITPTYLRTGEDPEAGRCLTLNPELFGDPMEFSLSTHLLSDPQFAGREGMALAFQCSGGFAWKGLYVDAIIHDWRPDSKTYTAHLESSELVGGWKKIVLPPARFKDADGKSLPGWSGVERLTIHGTASKQNPPRFTRFRWMPTEK